MTDIAIEPQEIEERRRERNWRLAAIELPALRLIGSVFLSFGVYLNNIYLIGESSLRGWLWVTTIIFSYALLTWCVLILFLKRDPPIDLTLPALAGDFFIWTLAIYASGAERSWLFFIPLLRVSDQTQTSFRRSAWFAIYGTLCYAAMLLWVVFVDGRDVLLQAAIAKLAFLFFGGLYVSLASRTSEARREQSRAAIHLARESIVRLMDQGNSLREERMKAEEANAAKSEFLANMSHEMRTPLQGVIGMLQLAIDDEPTERRARHLETAKRSAEVLLGTIDDILDFSKIEARKIELEPIYFSLRHLLSEIMKPLGVTAAARGLALSYFVQPDVADSVWGDPLRLRQVIVNLVGNAIKFTPTGEVTVRVTRVDELLHFEVRDTGIGIEPEVRRRIFEPFAQADSSHTRRFGGTGLGLAIVARLLETMGGSVEVDSTVGSGSVFTFSVKMSSDPVGAMPQRKAWESALAGRSVLIVEKPDLSRACIAEILRSRGVFASACATAAEAPDGRFACAVTDDVTLPIEPRVIIASPLAHVDHPLQVSRPVGERELIDAVGVALGLTVEQTEFVRDRPTPASRSMRILLVEDNEVNQEFVSETLRRLGHSVQIESDGEQALTRLAAEEFDLILMDVQMPGIDGLEVTRRFRESGKRTPIVAVTAHSGREERENCLAAGMNAVLTKPLYANQLGTIIATLTGTEAILEAVGGNVKLLARVSDAFAKQTPPLLLLMREAILHEDGEALARGAHKLKGSVSNFPGERAATLALELENAAASNDFSLAAEVMRHLEAAVAELEGRLNAAVGMVRR
jgi:signal transduction histidine kinase/DNA-binding NarL/FixJ family response regulator